jgi:hypothetical protein
MTRLVAVFHFEVNHLWVQAQLLGTSHVREYQGTVVRLTIPSSERDFGLDASRSLDLRALTGKVQQQRECQRTALEWCKSRCCLTHLLAVETLSMTLLSILWKQALKH